MDLANKVEKIGSEITTNEEKIDSTNKVDYQRHVTIESEKVSPEIAADHFYGKSWSIGMGIAGKVARQQLKKSANFKDSLKKVNKQKNKEIDSLIKEIYK